MKWKEEFSCFDLEIDNQHKKLFDLLSELFEIVKLKDSCDRYDEIMEIFQELGEYTLYHFNHEETLFEKYNYDSINKKIHILEHKTFIEKVNQINPNSIDEDQNGISLEIVLFLAKWVEDHILQTDKKFGEFLNKLKLFNNN